MSVGFCTCSRVTASLFSYFSHDWLTRENSWLAHLNIHCILVVHTVFLILTTPWPNTQGFIKDFKLGRGKTVTRASLKHELLGGVSMRVE